MSGVYTKRLVVAGGLTTTATAIVPDGVVWIVIDVTASADLIPSGGAELDVGISGSGLPITLVTPVGGQRSQHWVGHMVLYSKETLVAYARAGTWEVIVTGYELDA